MYLNCIIVFHICQAFFSVFLKKYSNYFFVNNLDIFVHNLFITPYLSGFLANRGSVFFGIRLYHKNAFPYQIPCIQVTYTYYIYNTFYVNHFFSKIFSFFVPHVFKKCVYSEYIFIFLFIHTVYMFQAVKNVTKIFSSLRCLHII